MIPRHFHAPGPSTMTTRTGGECAHEALLALGVRHVFGIPSIHNLPVFDAILRGGRIQPVIVRNEQCAVHSADGYARATGELGVVLASTGPGTTNTVTGIYEAAFACSPVLVLTGQVETIHYGKGRGAGHEAERQVQMLQSVARRVESPRHTHDIAPAIFRAVADIRTGRPQPAVVEIPIDIQYGSTDVPVGAPYPTHAVPLADKDIAAAQALLAEGTRRIIVAGGGVIGGDAAAELQALAERLDAVVFSSTNGHGALPEDHPLALGVTMDSPLFRTAWTDADVVLAVGTRFRGGPLQWNMKLPGKLIHLDIDARNLDLTHRADLALIGDAKLGLAALASGLNAPAGDREFVAKMQGVRTQVRASHRKRIGPDHAGIMDALRAGMPDDAIFVRDMTIPAYAWGNQYFPILQPRTTMNPVSGAIGPGIALANGAAVATGRKTVLLQGDGGFTMHIGELTTAVQYQLPVVVCVFTDGGYGVLRAIQRNNFEGRNIGVELSTPDFVQVARGMGLAAEKVVGLEAFAPALARAMAADGPYLIDIDASSLQPPTGFGAPRKVGSPGG